MKNILKSISLLLAFVVFFAYAPRSAFALTEGDEMLSVYQSDFKEVLNYDFSGDSSQYIASEIVDSRVGFAPLSDDDYSKFYIVKYSDADGDDYGSLTLDEGKLKFVGSGLYQTKMRVAIYFPITAFDCGHLYRLSYDEQKVDYTKHLDFSQLLMRPVAESASADYMSFSTPNDYALAENYNPGATVNVAHSFYINGTEGGDYSVYYGGQELNAVNLSGIAFEIAGDGIDWRDMSFFVDNLKLERDESVYPEQGDEVEAGSETAAAPYKITDFSDKKVGSTGTTLAPEYGKITLLKSDMTGNYPFDTAVAEECAGIARAREGASFATQIYSGENGGEGVTPDGEYILSFDVRLSSFDDLGATQVAPFISVVTTDEEGVSERKTVTLGAVGLTSAVTALSVPIVFENDRGTTVVYSSSGYSFDNGKEYAEAGGTVKLTAVYAGFTVVTASNNGIMVSAMALNYPKYSRYADFSSPNDVSGDVNSSMFALCLATGGFTKRRTAYGISHNGENASYGVGIKAPKCADGYVDLSVRLFRGPAADNTYKFALSLFAEQKTGYQFIFNVMTVSESGRYSSHYIYCDKDALTINGWKGICEYLQFSSEERDKVDALTGETVGTEIVKSCKIGDQTIEFTDTIAAVDVQIRLTGESETLYLQADDMTLATSAKRVGLKLADASAIIKNGDMENADLIDGSTPYGTVNTWAALDLEGVKGGTIESAEVARNGVYSLKMSDRTSYVNSPVYRIRANAVCVGNIYSAKAYVNPAADSTFELFMIIQQPDGADYKLDILPLSVICPTKGEWELAEGEFSYYVQGENSVIENAYGDKTIIDGEVSAIEFGVRTVSGDVANALTDFYLDDVSVALSCAYNADYQLYAKTDDSAAKINPLVYADKLDGVLSASSVCKVVSESTPITISQTTDKSLSSAGVKPLYCFSVEIGGELYGKIDIEILTEGNTENLRAVKVNNGVLTNMYADFDNGVCSFDIDSGGVYALIDITQLSGERAVSVADVILIILTAACVGLTVFTLWKGGRKCK